MTSSPLRVAVGFEGAGWHPESWRHVLTPSGMLSGQYWRDLAVTADSALIDFVTFDEWFTAQHCCRDVSQPGLTGRFDAVMVACHVAPATSRIGLVPVAATTHAEPFHISKAIATLDIISSGRAGWLADISPRAHGSPRFGRHDVAGQDTFAEAAEAVEVARRLWDSWEDDAVIRDVSSGRYIDRGKLHYVDFVGQHFSVKGPSITPRPPQGQPVVATRVKSTLGCEFASRRADLVFTSPSNDAELQAILTLFAGVDHARLKVFADVYVTSTDLADHCYGIIAKGGPAALVDLLLRWQRLGIDGVRLLPAVNEIDLAFIANEVLPLLRSSGVIPSSHDHGSLRDRLGLPPAANRYAKDN